MLVEDFQTSQVSDASGYENVKITLTGVVRGKGLQADRLITIGDWGDHQIESIDAAFIPQRKRGKPEDETMAVDNEGSANSLAVPTADQDDLAELAPDDIAMDDEPVSEFIPEKKGVLLDDHHYFSDDESHLPAAPKKLPKGTSPYQAAWYLGDMSDSDNDSESDAEMEGVDNGIEGEEDLEGGPVQAPEDAMTEAGPSEYPQSEMFLDPSPQEEAEELAEYRSRRKTEAEEDLEFPDEIELPPNVLARERLARYRGLKSLKTSQWETEEDRPHEPEGWRRLLQVADYKGARKSATREALAGGVTPGTRVHVHLRPLSQALASVSEKRRPMAMFQLLRHEHKQTVVNYSITLNSEQPGPIRSKEEIIVQCGPRRMVINPIFSQSGNTPNNVHKLERYLHPGRTAIATFIGPLTWGAVPVLYFKKAASPEAEVDAIVSSSPSEPHYELIATGTAQAPSQERVIAKRIILTGHPYKIHKKLVTVRYMFFNSDDVNWFKALQLWTRRGRTGFIKESLGTHGYFKATFDGKINPQDAVAVSLYKRTFPRWAKGSSEQ